MAASIEAEAPPLSGAWGTQMAAGPGANRDLSRSAALSARARQL